jgi:hypothetical protein
VSLYHQSPVAPRWHLVYRRQMMIRIDKIPTISSATQIPADLGEGML